MYIHNAIYNRIIYASICVQEKSKRIKKKRATGAGILAQRVRHSPCITLTQV